MKKQLEYFWIIIAATCFLSAMTIQLIIVFGNPDMTGARQLIEYWPRHLVIVSLIFGMIFAVRQLDKLSKKF